MVHFKHNVLQSNANIAQERIRMGD